jgi:hypothetical protein
LPSRTWKPSVVTAHFERERFLVIRTFDHYTGTLAMRFVIMNPRADAYLGHGPQVLVVGHKHSAAVKLQRIANIVAAGNPIYVNVIGLYRPVMAVVAGIAGNVTITFFELPPADKTIGIRLYYPLAIISTS